MGLPTLSAIIPNYNHGHCIGRALRAYLAQSVRPTEIIVIDDASTDDSVAVVEAFAAQEPIVRLLRNESNLGTHPAANRGIEYARGDYVHVTASDDEVLPGFVEKSLRVLNQYPHAGLCWSDNMTYDVEDKLHNANRLRLCSAPRYFSPAEIVTGLGRNHIPCFSGHSSVMRRSALREAGMLIPELHWHADGFTPTLVALRYGACYVPEVLTCAEMSPRSYMRTGVKQRCKRRQVLGHMLDLAQSPQYRDIYPAIRRSGFLGWFDVPILLEVLRHPVYWDLLTAPFLRRVLWQGVKKNIAGISPNCLKDLYHCLRDRYRQSVRRPWRESASGGRPG